MKIVHIQAAMTPAGNAAFRLHTSMREYGIDSSVLTLTKCSNRYNVHHLSRGRFFIFRKGTNKLNRYLKLYGKKKESYYYSCLPIIGREIYKNKLVCSADIIYLHWIAGELSVCDIIGLAKLGKPIIFFMHDMWDFTGGCHHSFDCEQYQTGCKDCPMFNSNKQTAKNQIARLKLIFDKFRNIHFVSPSKWMADCARKSTSIPPNKVHVISNLVDERVFKPLEKKIAKKILNLPTEKKIITFGCQAGTRNPFKGWIYLQKAINKIDREDIHIVIYGSDYSKETQEQINYPITFLGPIFDEHKLSLICNATDVFVSPSLAESFGLTFLENILCKTPVVGFNNTAISEIVKTDQTGYLANNKDAQDLSNGIEKMLSINHSLPGLPNYNSKDIIRQHVKLWEKLESNE